jgi:hypothetical protein
MRSLAILLALVGSAHADLVAPSSSRSQAIARCHAALAESFPRTSARKVTELRDVPDGVELVRIDHDPVTLARCTVEVFVVPQGRIVLPAGWIAIDRQGIDTRVGEIQDAAGLMRLRYDIGFLAGRYVQQARDGWTAQRTVASHLITWGASNGRFYATIDPYTNLWGAAASRADADRLAAIVLTLR